MRPTDTRCDLASRSSFGGQEVRLSKRDHASAGSYNIAYKTAVLVHRPRREAKAVYQSHWLRKLCYSLSQWVKVYKEANRKSNPSYIHNCGTIRYGYVTYILTYSTRFSYGKPGRYGSTRWRKNFFHVCVCVCV